MKNDINKTKQQGWFTLLALVIIAISVSIGFSPLFELVQGGIAAQILASSFGAIFVIILTMFLLNKQTEIEQESKKSERVFDEKVKIYQIVLDIIKDMLVDGILTKEEINKLPFPLIRLQMLSDDRVIKSFNLVFTKLNDIYATVDSDQVVIKDEDKDEIYEILTRFAAECRKDLYGSDVTIAPEILKQTVSAISESGKKEKDLTKYEFDGLKLAKNKYIWSVIKNHIDNNPDISLASFSDKVLGRNDASIDDGKRKNDFEIWKTYDEAIDLHINKNSKRYYVASRGKDYLTNKDLVIKLKDVEICISNQWTNETCLEFIELMTRKGIRTE